MSFRLQRYLNKAERLMDEEHGLREKNFTARGYGTMELNACRGVSDLICVARRLLLLMFEMLHTD